jgi:diguanylate cyclase (GGDEF)-like protein
MPTAFALPRDPIAIADLMDRPAQRGGVLAAMAFVAIFCVLTLIAIRYGNRQWPICPTFVSICATLWAVGDLLTAYLLLTQFSVNGVRAFAVIGAAYLIPGILTIPYLAYFPGVFFVAPLTPGVQQVSLLLWVTWHLAFPVVVGGAHLFDGKLSARVTTGAGVRRWFIGAGVCVACGGSAVVALLLVLARRGLLPILVSGGKLSHFYSTALTPAVSLVSALAAVTIVVAARRPSTLQLWLSAALVTASLDGALNAVSSGRYTASWYTGKIETLVTSTIVLMVLLSEISKLYRRLGTLATIDALTGLPNRQSFDNDARFALALNRRIAANVAFLVVDIDLFKQYNDAYGHLAGDDCLRRVAGGLRRACARTGDLVGRFGGEEFVVLLPGTTRLGAMLVAETIRAAIEALGIVHERSTVAAMVTVSVGATHVAGGEDATLESLFSLADAALYEAKLRRNAVAVSAECAPDLTRASAGTGAP